MRKAASILQEVISREMDAYFARIRPEQIAPVDANETENGWTLTTEFEDVAPDSIELPDPAQPELSMRFVAWVVNSYRKGDLVQKPQH